MSRNNGSKKSTMTYFRHATNARCSSSRSVAHESRRNASRWLSVLMTIWATTMKTYQIEYFVNGAWTPGLIVKMLAKHLKYYLEFLNGDRPLIAAHGWKKIHRQKDRCPPTRIRCVEPDWSQEDGYYEFDGMSLTYVSLTTRPRLMRRPPRRF